MTTLDALQSLIVQGSPNNEAYPCADGSDPLKDHDDPAADAKAGILSRDGGHFEAQFASGAEADALPRRASRLR